MWLRSSFFSQPLDLNLNDGASLLGPLQLAKSAMQGHWAMVAFLATERRVNLDAQLLEEAEREDGSDDGHQAEEEEQEEEMAEEDDD